MGIGFRYAEYDSVCQAGNVGSMGIQDSAQDWVNDGNAYVAVFNTQLDTGTGWCPGPISGVGDERIHHYSNGACWIVLISGVSTVQDILNTVGTGRETWDTPGYRIKTFSQVVAGTLVTNRPGVSFWDSIGSPALSNYTVLAGPTTTPGPTTTSGPTTTPGPTTTSGPTTTPAPGDFPYFPSLTVYGYLDPLDMGALATYGWMESYGPSTTTTTPAPTTTPEPGELGYTATPRIGYTPLAVQFTAINIEVYSHYRWYFGDGSSVEDDPNPLHVYEKPGIYSPILQIQEEFSPFLQVQEDANNAVNYNYIIVNEFIPPSDKVIIESFENNSNRDWKFYVDANQHLVFNVGGDIYKSQHPVIDMGVWTLVEFHPVSNKMYVAVVGKGRKEVPCYPNIAGLTGMHMEDKIYVAENTNMKIDELKITKNDVNLDAYFRSLQGVVYYLG